jgi:hypothetical protein
MTLASTTPSRTRPARSAAEVMSQLDVLKLVRLAVWLAFCVLLIVLA